MSIALNTLTEKQVDALATELGMAPLDVETLIAENDPAETKILQDTAVDLFGPSAGGTHGLNGAPLNAQPGGTLMNQVNQLAQGLFGGSVQLTPQGATITPGPGGSLNGNMFAQAAMQNLNAAAGTNYNSASYDAQGNVVFSASGAASGQIDLNKYVSRVPASLLPAGTITYADPDTGAASALDFASVINLMNSMTEDEEAEDLMMQIAADPNGPAFVKAINWLTGTAMAEYNKSNRPTDPLVEALLKAGEQDTDGSIYLSQQQVADHLTSIGKDPKSARGIMQMIVGHGAEDAGNSTIRIPPNLVQGLAPSLVDDKQVKVFGKRLPDGSAIITVDDARQMLALDGDDVSDPQEWLEQFVDYGAAMQGPDTILLPPDLVDAFGLAVPPIPSQRLQQAAQAQQSGQAGMPTSVAELFGLDEEIEIKRYKQIIQHDNFDREMFQDLVNMSPLMKQNVAAGEDVLKTWKELTFDLWNLLYKVQPHIRAEKEIDPTYLANLYLTSYALQTEGFDELRWSTAGSITDAILGYEVIVLEVLAYIRKCMEEYEAQKRAAEEAYKKALEEFMKNGGQPGDPNAPVNPVGGTGIMMPGAGQGFPMPGALMAAANQMAGAQQQMQQAADAAAAIGEMAAQAQQNGQQLPQALQDAMADAQQQQTQAQDLADKLQQQLEQAGKDLASELQRAMDEIGDKALSQTTPIRNWLDGWGIGGDNTRPDSVRVNFNDAKKAIERIRHNKEFQKFAKLLGRFRQIAMADVKKKSKKNGVAIKDVKVSNEVQNALAGEYALLGSPSLETEFYRKYAEGQLLTYVKENTDAKGKGPGVVCVDMSGSMGRDKMLWAKGVCLSLVEVFQKEGRDVIVIFFDDVVKYVWVFQKDRLDPNDLLDVSEIGACGGTDFEEPLEVALQAITGQYKHPKLKAALKKANLSSHKFKKADITFITDGDSMFEGMQFPSGKSYWNATDDDYKQAAKGCPFLKRYHEVKEEKEFACRTVLVNVGAGASDRCAKLFSDKIMRLDNVSDLSEAKAAEIFAQVRGLGGADDLDIDCDDDAIDMDDDD